MARRPSWNGAALPLSGAVTQAINPWSWWQGSMQQLGFVNVYNMESSDGDREREIVEDVASYGKQLGRIVEALEVLISHAQDLDLHDDEKRALVQFSEMAGQIAAVKDRHLTPSARNLDRLLAGLRRMKHHDPEAYERAREKLLEELSAE